MSGFVDLNRHFRDLTQAELDKPELLASLNDHSGGPQLTWPTLLEEPRVVLLAEAGAGKTREMQERAQALVRDGKAAFFVALEALAREPLSELLSADQERRFDAWRGEGNSLGWFFLDAVDELKLTDGKLDRALQRFAKDIDGHADRARIIISCRPNDWRPALDLAIVQSRLPLPPKQISTVSPDEEFLTTLEDDQKASPDSANENSCYANYNGAVRTVVLLPLSDRQIILLSASAQIKDVKAFLNEIAKKNAWTFARRPLDLFELIATWRYEGHLGTRTQQHEANITAKLRDDPGRADRGLLTDLAARQGAERLALALALSRTRTIRSPEQPMISERSEGVLDAAAVLPDWTERQRQALLRRALFDPATYGRVRFHHRSVQEYLAAKQLSRLRLQGMTAKAVFRLLFAERYSTHVVIPSMRSIAAWLALWDDAVLQELMRREPEVLITQADPETLSIEARNRLLRAFVTSYGKGSRRGLGSPIEEVRRLAHSALGPTIRQLWGSGPSNEDVRELLLELIWQGQIEECMDLALTASRDRSWNSYHRVTAVRALIACQQDSQVREIVSAILSNSPDWPPSVVRALIPSLFPEAISAHELIIILERFPEPKRSLGGLEWALQEIARSIDCEFNDARELRDGIAALIWDARHDEAHYCREESRYKYLAQTLVILCIRQLATTTSDANLLRACAIGYRFSHGYTSNDSRGELRALFQFDTKLRSQAFWCDLQLVDESTPSLGDHERLIEASFDGLIEHFKQCDQAWLMEALRNQDRPERHALALQALLKLWDQRSGALTELAEIQAIIKEQPALVDLVKDAVAAPRINPHIARFMRRQEARERSEATKKEQKLQQWKEWRKNLTGDPAAAFSNLEKQRTIAIFYKWLSSASHDRSRYGTWNESLIRRIFGDEVLRYAEAAFKEAWRNVTPVLWSNRSAEERNNTPYTWVYGLCGLAAESAAPNWSKHLTSEEARIAVAFSQIELNGIATFVDSLVASHPDEVDEVLGAELTAELAMADVPYPPLLLGLLNSSNALKKLVRPRLKAHLLELFPVPELHQEQRFAEVLSSMLRLLNEVVEQNDRATVALKCKSCFEAAPWGTCAIAWLRGLFLFDPEEGIEALVRRMGSPSNQTTRIQAVEALATLFGDRDVSLIDIANNQPRARLLGRLIRFAYAFVRPEDD